ncbi:MAG: Calx-beta domain-containing protein [Pirellulales bacterium]
MLTVGDVETGNKQVTVTVNHGAVAFGSGTASQNLSYTGTVAQINVQLNTLRFNAPSSYAGPVQLTVTINDLDGTGGGALSASKTVDIRVRPTITIDDASANEAAGTMSFTVRLSASTDEDVSVAWQTQFGTANAADFTAASGTLTILAGQSTGTITIALTNDGRDEDNQTFSVLLANPQNGVLVDSTGIGTIIDDEAAPTVYVVSREVRESDGEVQLHIRLSHESEKTVVVSWYPSDGTAVRSDSEGNILDWYQGTWVPGWYDQEWVDTSYEEEVWIDESYWGDVWIDEYYEQVWVEDWQNYPIWIDPVLDEEGTVIEDGYWEDNWIDEGGYEDQLVEGHYEWGWIEDGHYETQWIEDGYYQDGMWNDGYWDDGGNVVFTPGTIDQVVSVYVVDDEEVEESEYFNIYLQDAQNAVASNLPLGTVTIRSSDHPPEFTNGNIEIDLRVGTTWTYSVQDLTSLMSAVDPDGGQVTLELPFGETAYGLLVDHGGGNFSYEATYAGSDYLTVIVRDDEGLEAEVSLVFYNTANNAPTATDFYENVVAPGEQWTFTKESFLSAVGAVDLDDDELSLSFEVESGNGTFTDYGNGTYRYVAPTAGGMSLTFTISDGYDSASGTLNVLVNAAPNGVADSYTVAQDDSLVIDTWDLLVNDENDDVYGTTFDGIVAGPTHGALVLQPDGTYLYTPEEGFHGSDSFTYGLVDIYGATGTGTVTVTVTELQLPKVTASYAPVTEGSSSVVVTLTLSEALSEDLTIEWSTNDGSARAGVEYVAGSSSVTFLAGETTAQITIGLLNDAMDEDDKSFLLELTGPETIEFESAVVEVVIADDDASPTLSISDATANEATGFIEFTVTLSAASDRVVFVDWTTANGTAGASEFDANNGRLAFAAGETSRTIVVELVNDNVHEADKSFQITLSNPENATIAGSNSAVGTIVNDDAVPTIRVVSAAASENVGFAEIIVELSHPSESSISVNWSAVDGTAESPDDYDADVEHPLSGTLNFAPGVTQRTITLPIINDLAEEADETVGIELSDPTGGTLAEDSDGTLTIRDNDRVRIVIDDQEFNEDDGVVSIMLALEGDTEETVTVTWEVIDDSAEEDVEFELVKPRLDEHGDVIPNEWDVLTEEDARTLTFVPGEDPPVIYVRIIDDEVFDGDRSFKVRLSAPVNANVPQQDAEIAILDDETVPGYLSNLGVTAQNYTTMFPPQVPAPLPTPQPADPLPTFPMMSPEFEIASRADAVRTVTRGLLKDLDSWQRDNLSVVPGMLETENGYGRIYVSADGSFSFVPTFSDELSNNTPEELEDTFEFEIRRIDGSTVTRTANLTIRPSSPTLTVDTPSSIGEGEEGEVIVTVGENAGPVSLEIGGARLDDLDRPTVTYHNHLSWLDDAIVGVEFQPGALAHYTIKVIDDNGIFPLREPNGYAVLAVYATARDIFWGTRTTIRQEVTIENRDPEMTISAPSGVSEGEPFIVTGKITDPGTLDGFNLNLQFQGREFNYLLPSDTSYGDGYYGFAWNSLTREFAITLTAGDESPEEDAVFAVPFSNDLKFTLSDGDGGYCEKTQSLTVTNLPPRISFNLQEQSDGSYDLGINILDSADGCEVEYTVFDENGVRVSDYLGLDQISAHAWAGWTGTITVTDDDGAETTRSFSVPDGMPAPMPDPVYNVQLDVGAFLARRPPEPETEPKPTVNPEVRVFAADAFDADDGITFVFESEGGETDQPEDQYLEVKYKIVNVSNGNSVIEEGSVVLSYAGSRVVMNKFNVNDFDTDWDTTIKLIVTEINRIEVDEENQVQRTSSEISVTNLNTSATIHGNQVVESIDINLTQDPGAIRNRSEWCPK